MTSSSSNLVRRTTTPNATPSNWPTSVRSAISRPSMTRTSLLVRRPFLTRCSFKHPSSNTSWYRWRRRTHLGVLLSREGNGRCDVKVTGLSQWRVRDVPRAARKRMSEVVHHPRSPTDWRWGDEGAITNELIAHHEVPLVLVEEIEIRRAVREAAEVNGSCSKVPRRRPTRRSH